MSNGILEQLLAAITLNNQLLQQQSGGAAAAPAGDKPLTAAEKKKIADEKKKADEAKKGPVNSVASTTALVTEVKERLGADKAREALMVDGTQLKLNQLTNENSDVVFEQATKILEEAEEADI